MGIAWKDGALLLLFLSLVMVALAHHPFQEGEAGRQSSSESNQLEGGFSSLNDGMLQWAISHSDPRELKEKARDIQGLSKDELTKMHLEMKELTDKLKVPSDAELMQAAIATLNNSSASLEDHHCALEELLILVEWIDNANGIRMISIWIIRKASQNNPVVQRQVLHLKALSILMKMVESNFTGEASKPLYAISAAISNNLYGQELLYSENVDLMLQALLSNSSTDVGLLQKSASLIADLAEFKLKNRKEENLPSIKISLVKNLVNLTASSTNLDLQEKALMAMRNFVKLTVSSKELGSSDCWYLHEALVKMRAQLEGAYKIVHASEIKSLIESLHIELDWIR